MRCGRGLALFRTLLRSSGKVSGARRQDCERLARAPLDRAADASLRMDYEQRSFPFVWFFLSYGGWRDVYTAVLEPCTNMPKDLAEAVRRSQSARLLPGAAFETTLRVSLSGAGGLTSHMS